MIIEIPNENSIVKWKNDDKDEWKVAEISDLIKAYERPLSEPEKVLVASVTFDEDKLKEIVETEVIEKIKSGELVIKDERPQGNLKSVEALKAYAREVLCGNNPTNSLLIRMFDEIIDNAPTVESNISETYGLGYEQGFRHGKEKYERPQGEWIKKVDDVGFISYICSKCGFELELEDCSDSYYCTNCGVGMRVKKNEGEMGR